jgi:hypothetical protein
MRSSPGAPHSTERCKVTKKNIPIQANAPFFEAVYSPKCNKYYKSKKNSSFRNRGADSAWISIALVCIRCCYCFIVYSILMETAERGSTICKNKVVKNTPSGAYILEISAVRKNGFWLSETRQKWGSIAIRASSHCVLNVMAPRLSLSRGAMKL